MSGNVWPKAVPLLILAGLCAYANCYSKTLVFDDDAWIVDQPLLEKPREYLESIEGRPLLGLTNLALHRLGRNNPLGHHVLNVLIHLAATLTVYGVVRRALLSPRFRGRFDGRAPYLAFAVALLWMLHPLQVQCVTYVIQRGESMAGLFYLFILYAMQRADAAAGRRRAAGWYALAVLSLVLGFGSKEIMATAPGAVLLFDRIFLAPSIRQMTRRRWAYYLVFLLVWGAFTGWHLDRASGSQSGIGFKVEVVTAKEYALTQTGVLLYYLRLCFWPRGMSIDYQSWPWWHTFGEAMPEAAIVIGMLVVTTVLVFWRPAVGFVCAWYFLILLPTSSVLPIVDAVFEHRMYLSLAAPVILAVFLSDWLLRLVRVGWLRPYVLAAAALALGALTHLRNEEYRSRAQLWEIAVERMPDSIRARANLAQGLILDNRNEEVIPVLERALELAPTDSISLINLAAAHEQLGNFRDSTEYYRRLRDAYPTDWKHWRMLAASLLVLGGRENLAAAAEAYEKAAELKGDEAEPYYGRAAALYALGMDAEGDEAVQKASAFNPDWPTAVLGTARSAIMDERTRENPLACRSALTWAKLGIKVMDKPESIHWDTLALCYAANGDFDRAIVQSHTALLITPDGPWGAVHRDRLRYYVKKQVPWE